jgi:O-antigen ligase
VAAVVLFVDGLAGGGYLPRTWRLTTFALATLVAAALVGRRRIALARAEVALLVALLALTAWTVLSVVWSDTPENSVLEAERNLVYIAGVAAVLLTTDRASLPILLGGVLAGLTAVCGYGLGTYVIFGPEQNPIQGRLLFEPLGYANAVGIYAALGIVLAVGLALAIARRPVRIACAAAVAILAPTLYLTHSRAAELALALGLAVVLRFTRALRRPVALAVGGAATAAAVAVVVVAARSESGLAARLFGENRPHYWRVAWRQFEDNTSLGSGAGTFERYWLRYRPVSSFARDAHSVYLEKLAELGPVGLALLLTALALPLVALRVRRDPLLAAAAGSYVLFLVHAGVDWDWELPAVTVAGLTCGGAMLVATRPADARELGDRSRLALLVPALALAALALVRLATGPRLPFHV